LALGDFLNADNMKLASEVMQFVEDVKPAITGRLKGWLNNSPTSLEYIVENLTDERAKELADLLVGRLTGGKESDDHE